MKEITRFDCKIRINANGQTWLTVPKVKAHKVREDQPVTIVVLPRVTDQMQLKKEVVKGASKQV